MSTDTQAKHTPGPFKFRIHYQLPNGQEDSIDISGETLEEIREKATCELNSRNATDQWSEEL